MPWSRAFHVPLTTPDGFMLHTFAMRANTFRHCQERNHKQPEWQVAAEMLLAAVEGSGPLMFAEIAMRKAVHAEKKPAPEPTPCRKAAKK